MSAVLTKAVGQHAAQGGHLGLQGRAGGSLDDPGQQLDSLVVAGQPFVEDIQAGAEDVGSDLQGLRRPTPGRSVAARATARGSPPLCR